MKQDTPLGSRIAEVHNGSSLFTGDAGQPLPFERLPRRNGTVNP